MDTLIKYNEDGTFEKRPLTQPDRDALFGPMFSLPKTDVWWSIEAIDGGLTRIWLGKAKGSTANVPTLDITGTWEVLINAVTDYVKQYKALNGSQQEATDE